MLSNTFCHIPDVGQAIEKKLWGAGILSWDDFLRDSSRPLSQHRADAVADHVSESQQQLASHNARYFFDRLPSNQHWRLFRDFRDSLAYLDIETTGLSPRSNIVTAIAVYDGKDIHTYVHGQNLDDFPKDIAGYRLLVTYSGKTFDIPFIEEFFRIKLDQARIDLRYLLHSFGHRGGLKKCERAILGDVRGELNGVDGSFAVQLWRDYTRNHNKKALDTLVAYNIKDVVNLEALLVYAYNRKLSDTPFRDESVSGPATAPASPYRPDPGTIRRIMLRRGLLPAGG